MANGTKTYLDDNGNVIGTPAAASSGSPTYLDEQGNPVSASSATPATPPHAFVTAASATGLSAPPKHNAVTQWGSDAINDIKYGNDTTAVGRLMKRMGAPGTANSGVPEGVSDFMASPLLGPARMVKGGGELAESGHRWQGTKDVVGGGLDAVAIPSLVYGGSEADTIAGKIGDMIPTKASAGAKFNEVSQAAGHLSIDPTGPANAAADAVRESKLGGPALPKPIKDFLARLAPSKGQPGPLQLTYDEARTLYSNATRRLTPDEWWTMTPQMRRHLANFTSELGQAITDTADSVNKGDMYQSAMREWRNASRLNKALKTLTAAGVTWAADEVLGGKATSLLKKLP